MFQMEYLEYICFWAFTSYKRRNDFTNFTFQVRTFPAIKIWQLLQEAGPLVLPPPKAERGTWKWWYMLLDVVWFWYMRWLTTFLNHIHEGNMDIGGMCISKDKSGIQMTSDQLTLGYLLYTRHNATQLYRDFNTPLRGSRHEPIRISWKWPQCFWFEWMDLWTYGKI